MLWTSAGRLPSISFLFQFHTSMSGGHLSLRVRTAVRRAHHWRSTHFVFYNNEYACLTNLEGVKLEVACCNVYRNVSISPVRSDVPQSVQRLASCPVMCLEIVLSCAQLFLAVSFIQEYPTCFGPKPSILHQVKRSSTKNIADSSRTLPTLWIMKTG
jgi:hypothetical protein